MTHWHDKMVDQPDTDSAVYVTGTTISGLAVLDAILGVWVFGTRIDFGQNIEPENQIPSFVRARSLGFIGFIG